MTNGDESNSKTPNRTSNTDNPEEQKPTEVKSGFLHNLHEISRLHQIVLTVVAIFLAGASWSWWKNDYGPPPQPPTDIPVKPESLFNVSLRILVDDVPVSPGGGSRNSDKGFAIPSGKTFKILVDNYEPVPLAMTLLVDGYNVVGRRPTAASRAMEEARMINRGATLISGWQRDDGVEDLFRTDDVSAKAIGGRIRAAFFPASESFKARMKETTRGGNGPKVLPVTAPLQEMATTLLPGKEEELLYGAEYIP